MLDQLGLELKAYADIVAQYQNIGDIAQLIKAEKRYFRITVDAKDIYSASHIAISKLATVLNLASFYNLVDAWDLKSVVIVTINNYNSYHRSFTAESLYTTYDYLDSSGRVFESTRKIFLMEPSEPYVIDFKVHLATQTLVDRLCSKKKNI